MLAASAHNEPTSACQSWLFSISLRADIAALTDSYRPRMQDNVGSDRNELGIHREDEPTPPPFYLAFENTGEQLRCLQALCNPHTGQIRTTEMMSCRPQLQASVTAGFGQQSRVRLGLTLLGLFSCMSSGIGSLCGVRQ